MATTLELKSVKVWGDAEIWCIRKPLGALSEKRFRARPEERRVASLQGAR
jgi:hypothetical protein